MAALRQRLEQKLQQKLSPQQIQLMKLLQVPAIALEQRIKQEIEENPALEDFSEDADEGNDSLQDDDAQENVDEGNQDDDFSLEDYLDDDYESDYRLNARNRSADDEEKEIPFVSQNTFYEQLYEQLQMRDLTETEHKVGKYIIGNIDENGYLKRDAASLSNDLAFSSNVMVDADKIENY